MSKRSSAHYLKSSEDGPVVITRNGRPVAVLLGVADEEEIERLLMAYSPRLRAILDRSRVQIGKGENVAHEQLWTEDEPPATSPISRRIKRNETTLTAQRPRDSGTAWQRANAESPPRRSAPGNAGGCGAVGWPIRPHEGGLKGT